MAKSILISKNLDDHSTIKKWFDDKTEFNLIHQSQIKIEFQKSQIPSTQWVFFSSKNAVKGYFNNHGQKDVRFATIGSGTANTLSKYDCTADFVGTNNDTEKIAQDFQIELGDETVLFPIGNLSKRNMAQFIDKSQIRFSIVYESILEPVLYEEPFDVIVFTSPSNVDSFIKKNHLNPNQKIISIGKTTAKHLKKINPKLNVTIPNSFSEEDLLDSIKTRL